MAFTTFDLSTAEFPDSEFTGSYVDGALVPDQPGLGMIFWIPGMTRNLTSWFTIVVDFEVQGDAPYSGRPRANAFQWRNDGDYASSSGSNLAIGDTGQKPVQSLVFQVAPGGDPGEERVAFFVFANVPPITGVRWQESSSALATSPTFPTAQAVEFGPIYEIAWDSMPADPAENAALGTPDAIGSAWFTFTLPADGIFQGLGLLNGTIYSGSSLGSLTYVADTGSIPTLSAGTYYVRSWSQFGGFSNFASFIAYRAETIFGPWTTPNPTSVDFDLGANGDTTPPTGLSDLALSTQQGVDAGQTGRVATWDEFTDSSGSSAAPPFSAPDLQDVISSAAFSNPGTFLSTPAAVGWRIVNKAIDGIPGSTDGHRDYQAQDTRVAWFVGLSVPVTPPVDSLASGWENEDGSSDTTPDAIATTGELEATFAHLNATDDGGEFLTGGWGTHFATVEGAPINGGGNVDYDVIAHAGTVIFDFLRDSDNANEDRSASLTMPAGDTFGFVQWTDPPVGLSEDKTGSLGTRLFTATFTVAYQAPDFRDRFEGIEVLLPLSGEVVATGAIPWQRLTNRDAVRLTNRRDRQNTTRLTGIL